MYAPSTGPSTTRRVVLAVLTSVVASLVVVGLAVAFALWRDTTWQRPDFPSLADHPDPSVQGTVAYLDEATSCVDVVAAGGGPAREVYCLEDEPVATSKELGKPLGPQLVWLEDGRLEVTMFRMTDPPGPSFEPGWQRIVDVRTGEVEKVADAAAPGATNRGTHPTTNARGETVAVETGDRSVDVVLTTRDGSRTLLAAEDIPEGGYAVGAAFWAPSGDWIAVDDGRVLVVVPGAAEEVRVLTEATEMSRFDPELARFAITDEDLVGAAR